MSSSFVWHDLFTSDLETSKTFTGNYLVIPSPITIPLLPFQMPMESKVHWLL